MVAALKAAILAGTLLSDPERREAVTTISPVAPSCAEVFSFCGSALSGASPAVFGAVSAFGASCANTAFGMMQTDAEGLRQTSP
jgi:hypothetical protein